MIRDNCLTIATHKHGCCVLQRCLEKGSLEQKNALAEIIINNITTLIKDPFGNYLVQNIFELNDEVKIRAVVKKIEISFIELSKHKFSSNVIERCLESGAFEIGDELKTI